MISFLFAWSIFCVLLLSCIEGTNVAQIEPWGIVLVDLRDIFSIRLHRLIRHLAAVSPNRPVELHIGKEMKLPSDLEKLHPFMEIKYLDLPLNHDPRHSCCGRTRHGYISKAYALLASSFQTSFFFDADVWFCNGWEDAIDYALQSNLDSKILWVYEDDKFGDSSGNNSRYWSPEIKPQLSSYLEFSERNTGTILGIRKCGISNDFLHHVIELWKVHNEHYISSTDQGSFREAAFLHKLKINEAILPEASFCRAKQGTYSYGGDDGDPNQCNCKQCKIVHYIQFFDMCSRNMSIPSENEYGLTVEDPAYNGHLPQ